MKSIADELMKLLVDSDPAVRTAAAGSVGMIGEPMQPQLEAALETMTPAQRHEVGMASSRPSPLLEG